MIKGGLYEETLAFFGVGRVVVVSGDGDEVEASFTEKEFELVGVEIMIGCLGNGAMDGTSFWR